jgi:hypothetical protein
VICFLLFGLRRISFDIDFLLPGLRKISYLCIEFNLFEIGLMLQLKISHRLANIVVIDMF